MGLDVYLYKFEDLKTSQRIQKENEDGSEQIWAKLTESKKYEELTDEQKNEARKQTDLLERELKVKENEGEKIEFNSFRYPLHYFKVGYFRSSYNRSGFNHVVGDAIGVSLNSLLNPNDEYEFVPDWQGAKQLTEEAIKKFSVYIQNGAYRVADIRGYHDKVNSSEEALKVFRAQLDQQQKYPDAGFESYSNSAGEFMLKGFEIKAVINGKDGVYLIFQDKEMSWYLEALEIILETIEHVLNQRDPEKYVLHWSS